MKKANFLSLGCCVVIGAGPMISMMSGGHFQTCHHMELCPLPAIDDQPDAPHRHLAAVSTMEVAKVFQPSDARHYHMKADSGVYAITQQPVGMRVA